MTEDEKLGQRIRNLRESQCLQQYALAKKANISAGYLNLIEHGRRRIGGRVLIRLAEALGIDQSLLRAPLDLNTKAALKQVFCAENDISSTDGMLDQLSLQFPDIVSLILQQKNMLETLRKQLALRYTQVNRDPDFQVAFHDLLSMITSVRSSAAILSKTPNIEPEWQARFQKNVYEDSMRMASSAEALLGVLEKIGKPVSSHYTSPFEEFTACLQARGYFFAALENGAGNVEAVLDEFTFQDKAARVLMKTHLKLYQEDAALFPAKELLAKIETYGNDPAALQRGLEIPWSRLFRRLTALPSGEGALFGGICVDVSGAILFQKTLAGLSIAPVGEICPLWPVFSVFSQPFNIVKKDIKLENGLEFGTVSFCTDYIMDQPDIAVAPKSYMLISPPKSGSTRIQEVGTTCSLCRVENCNARRIPSLV